MKLYEIIQLLLPKCKDIPMKLHSICLKSRVFEIKRHTIYITGFYAVYDKQQLFCLSPIKTAFKQPKMHKKIIYTKCDG